MNDEIQLTLYKLLYIIYIYIEIYSFSKLFAKERTVMKSKTVSGWAMITIEFCIYMCVYHNTMLVLYILKKRENSCEQLVFLPNLITQNLLEIQITKRINLVL